MTYCDELLLQEQWCSTLLIFREKPSFHLLRLHWEVNGHTTTALSPCRSLVFCSFFSLLNFCLHRRINLSSSFERWVSLFITFFSWLWLLLLNCSDSTLILLYHQQPIWQLHFMYFSEVLLQALGRHTSLANKYSPETLNGPMKETENKQPKRFRDSWHEYFLHLRNVSPRGSCTGWALIGVGIKRNIRSGAVWIPQNGV